MRCTAKVVLSVGFALATPLSAQSVKDQVASIMTYNEVAAMTAPASSYNFNAAQLAQLRLVSDSLAVRIAAMQAAIWDGVTLKIPVDKETVEKMTKGVDGWLESQLTPILDTAQMAMFHRVHPVSGANTALVMTRYADALRASVMGSLGIGLDGADGAASGGVRGGGCCSE